MRHLPLPTNRTPPVDVSRHGRAWPLMRPRTGRPNGRPMGRYGDRMPTVRRPARPLAAQSGAGLLGVLVLLAVLAATVGLRAPGALIGVAYGLTLTVLLIRAMQRSGRTRLGPADAVTLARAVLIGGLTALVADSFSGSAQVPVMVTLASVALALDAVDGRVARRTGTVSHGGSPVRHGGRRRPAAGPVGVRRAVARRLGPADRRGPLPVRRGELGMAMAARSHPASLLGQGRGGRSGRRAHRRDGGTAAGAGNRAGHGCGIESAGRVVRSAGVVAPPERAHRRVHCPRHPRSAGASRAGGGDDRAGGRPGVVRPGRAERSDPAGAGGVPAGPGGGAGGGGPGAGASAARRAACWPRCAALCWGC